MNRKPPPNPVAVRQGKLIAKLSSEALAVYLDKRLRDVDLVFDITHDIMSANPNCNWIASYIKQKHRSKPNKPRLLRARSAKAGG